MRLDVRYIIVCVLTGLGVCATIGALSGVGRVLISDELTSGGIGTAAGTVVASGLAGLLMGAAVGVLIGALAGVVATFTVGGRTDPSQVALRVGVAVGLTYLSALLVGAGLAGGAGWQLPGLIYWVGVLVPSALAALAAARAAREVPTLEAPGAN